MNDFENISEITKDGFPLLNKRYKLIKKIGEGSYGVVYKAEDISNKNSLVAIKQISKMRINSNSYLIEALKKELYIMRLLSDENSVNLIEDFETEEKYNLVMELCDSDLDIELKKRKSETKKGFNELEVQTIMNQFNKIFKKMQIEHVIHRDLKLKNIMIKKDKNIDIIGFLVKLSDFGFSKVMNEGDITDTNLGSPATKAPEIMKGNEYNAKADLWSIGVIIYQLFFDSLPFPAKTARELKEAIFRASGVRLPKGCEDSMTQICFDLIDKLLQKDPIKRIDFDNYFKHKFFSEEHKKYLIEQIKNNSKNEKVVYRNINEENIIKEEKSENESNSNSNSNKEIKIFNIKDNDPDFEKRFLKKLILNENKLGYKLYKAKDTTYDKYVFIKEIKKTFIDNNNIYKNIFSKEIKLLTELKGKKFPEFYGLYITDTYYYIIMEYFSGNNLYNFINRRNNLNENLIRLILLQIKSSIIELNEKNIFLDFISPKNFGFTFYQSDTNFEIKFFDYGLYSIFYEEKFIKNYLLEESKLGDEPNASINVLSMGLTVYKMLFGEEAIVKKNEEDYEIKIKGKIKGEYSDNLKIFLSKCIKKENRYTWSEFYLDDFLNGNEVDQKILISLEKYKEPKIKDEIIETLFEIIIKKINYINNYFDKILKEKDKDLGEIYLKFYDEIIIFLLFCSLECKTIIKFLKIHADITKEKSDATNQTIHIFKVYITKNTKDNNKYDYSYINFLTENKNDLKYLYNKENPTFEFYLKIFNDLYKKISSLLNKFLEKNDLNNSAKDINLDESDTSSDVFQSACSHLSDLDNQGKALSDNLGIRYDKEVKLSQKGNLEKLFMYYFENSVMKYTNEEKDTAIEELRLAKYIVEYATFQRVILGNKDKTMDFEKIKLNNHDEEKSKEDENAIFATFIGGKIKQLKDIEIIGYNSSSINENINEYNDPKIENIKIYDNMINFYPRIIQFIDEIKKEKN